jgi:hypothetical protein
MEISMNKKTNSLNYIAAGDWIYNEIKIRHLIYFNLFLGLIFSMILMHFKTDSMM